MRRAADVIAEGDLGAVVDYTIDLNREKVQIEKELNEAKVFLRDQAKLKSKGSFEVELEGLSGTLTVTFPGLELKTKKGKDLTDLEVSLPPEVFSSLFHKKIVVVPAMPADDFLEVLAQQKGPHASTVRHFVEAVEQTPKVFVPR